MILKTEKEIAVMREGGSLLADIMRAAKEIVAIGVSTKEIDFFVEKEILRSGGTPSFKGYNGFPAATCTSVNHILVHGVPSDYRLRDGDLLSLDIGLYYKGFHTDMAVTVAVGDIDDEKRRLMRETQKALKRGIKKVRVGNTLGDVGNTIMRHAQKSGFHVAKGLCGHGIGREIHEDPQVLNEGKRRKGLPIVEGMVFCIEPMLIQGTEVVVFDKDNMSIKSCDNSLCAHFEHTVAVTSSGVEILTN